MGNYCHTHEWIWIQRGKTKETQLCFSREKGGLKQKKKDRKERREPQISREYCGSIWNLKKRDRDWIRSG